MQGREWERFAWLKSRVVAPRASVAERPRAGAAQSLVTAVRLPPLPRLRRVRGPAPAAPQGARRGAAPRRRPARARQRRQAVARRHPRDRVHRAAAAGGARRPVPRDPHPLDAEGARQARRRRPDEAAPAPTRLAEAYTFLRRVEHRIQYLDDQQTHLLPTDDADLDWIARSLGHGGDDGTCELLDQLGEAREFVATRVRRAAARRPPRRASGKRLPQLRPGAAAGRQRGLPRLSCRPSCAARVRPLCEQPKIRLLRDESKLRLAPPDRSARRRRCADGALHARPRRVALHRLARAAAAARELPRAAGRAARGAEPPAAPARPGALADALPDAAPGRDRRAGRRAPAARPLRRRRLQGRARGAPRGAGSAPARPTRSRCSTLAPRPPRRGVPHAGARRRGPHHGRAGRRRSVGAGRRDARVRAALGLEAPEERAPRPSRSFGGHRLRQARRQGARLRQRPRRRVRLRRRRRATPTRRPRSTAPSCAS